MKFMRIYCISIMLCLHHGIRAQIATDSLLTLPDSVRPLTIDNFYHLVLQHHPVARQADLLNEFARQEMRLARGNFDPKLEAKYLVKNFADIEYYRIFDGSVAFPSIFPVDPRIGVENNSGKYLNPERYISGEFDFRQFYAGVSLPLLRGFITDERRAALKQAELFGDMMEAEQIRIINELFLEAAKDYWQWSVGYYNFRLYNQNLAIAEEIFSRVKMNFELGEASPVDTIQAKITLQQRLVERQEAFLEFRNAGIKLSNYLWDSLSQPLDLSAELAPVLNRDIIGIQGQDRDELLNLARSNHPALQKLNVTLQQLDVNRKLAAELMKPRLDVHYYFLNQPFDPKWNSSLRPGENYKFGVDFDFPIFLRKERARLAQTRLKISNTKFERSLTERDILNEVNASYNSVVNSGVIIRQQSDMVDNYNRLLQAELLNLENGESDLFKINIQIEKLIQAQSKLIKLLGDYEKQKAYLYWAAGVRRLN